MDTEALVRWALDDARTVEERYTTELIVEHGVNRWESRQGIHRPWDWDAISALKRERALNPAYEPRYSEEALRKAAEGWTDIKEWSEFCSYDDRAIRDIQVLRFLPSLEQVHLQHCEVADVSPLAELPRLRSLHFSSHTCRDLRPIARCTSLRDLQLTLLRHWPDVRGLADLPEVESLLLVGNLLVFERAVWRKARFAVLRCHPLEARHVRDLPQLPNCEFLSLAGIETLDGIQAFPSLRNLTLETDTESFEPLTGLPHLTWFTAKDFLPIEVTPLTRVPKLQYVCFNTWNKHRMRPVKPRDLSPLVEATALRELQVVGNPILETEAAAIQAGLPGWDDLYLLPEARPLPPMRLLAWPNARLPRTPEVSRLPEEPEQVDLGLRKRELDWAGRFLRRAIDRKLGTSDWCEREKDSYNQHEDFAPHIINPTHRSLGIQFESYGLIEKIPLAVEAMRECLARFRGEYHVHFWVRLKAPKRKITKAQKEQEKKFQREQDEAEHQRAWKDREEYLKRLHRFELKKQEGIKVEPGEFAPGEQEPLPTPPWERAEKAEDAEDDADGGADVAVKKKPDPPPSPWEDDGHPLSDQYNLSANFTLAECYVHSRDKSLVEYLFRRRCDEVIEEEKEK